MSHHTSSTTSPRGSRLAAARAGLSLVVVLLFESTVFPASPSIDISIASQTPVGTPEQRLAQLLRKRLPGQSAQAIDRAQQAFLEHLKSTSPIISEEFLSGRTDVDDIASRLDIFVSDHPEFSGAATPAAVASPRQQVVDLLVSCPT
jgi:hypothetical protein